MKKAKKRQRTTKRKVIDSHHLLWPRHDWNKGYCKALRTHWYFVMPIPKRTLHAKIHHEIMWVPPPRGSNARGAYEQILMLEKYGALHPYDTIEQRLDLLIALFQCVEPETVSALRAQQEIVRKFYKHPRY